MEELSGSSRGRQEKESWDKICIRNDPSPPTKSRLLLHTISHGHQATVAPSALRIPALRIHSLPKRPHTDNQAPPMSRGVGGRSDTRLFFFLTFKIQTQTYLQMPNRPLSAHSQLLWGLGQPGPYQPLCTLSEYGYSKIKISSNDRSPVPRAQACTDGSGLPPYEPRCQH